LQLNTVKTKQMTLGPEAQCDLSLRAMVEGTIERITSLK